MATTESMPRSAFPLDRLSAHAKSIPIHPSASAHHPRLESPPSASPSDPMEVNQTISSSMPPPATSSPPRERPSEHKQTTGDQDFNSVSNGQLLSHSATAASQQPKVVQTAFIHKLYNMLEDQQIQHLISWAPSNDSFVMSPSQEFAKVLAQYFKHTNISSFVRQLNMYGFHKVSDVFHNGAPDSTLWEFRHGNGNFKRGDILGLREIKRRASRHTLINRDTFPTGPKPLAPLQPLNGPQEMTGDTLENRLNDLETHYFNMHTRLARSEDSLMYLNNKCQVLSDGLKRCHQWNQDLATYLTTVVPDPESQLHKDIVVMQREIARQTDYLKSVESPDPNQQEPRPIFPQQQLHYVGNHLHDGAPPLSPRQMPAPDNNQRRPSQPLLLEPRAPPPSFRTAVGSHIVSPRRYGSIGSNSSYSPASSRAPPPPPPTLIQPPPPPQHPLSNVSSPPGNLSRRHTSADIRLGGWGSHGPPTPGTAGSQYSGGHASGWPSSPAPASIAENALRDQLAQYELPRAQQRTPPSAHRDQLAAIAGTGSESAWAVPGSRFPGFAKGFGSQLDTSGGPPTRRSSMASNLHGLLNPAGETLVEEPESTDTGGGKRKRIL